LQPQTVQNVVTYTTVIDVPNDDGRLRPGMTSTASILVARAENTLRVPAAAVRFTPTEDVLKEFPAEEAELVASEGTGRRRSPNAGAAVWQLVEGRLQRIPVRVGVSDGANVAITTNRLTEGASVVTGVARSDTNAVAAAPSGSPLMPQLPRRGGSRGGATR
jgi:HlyD family secretion protein